MKLTITHIKLQLGDREIDLTAAEARTLHEELSKLFAQEQTTLQELQKQFDELKNNPPQPNYVPVPYPTPNTPALPPFQPWPTSPIIVPDNPRWTTWCGTGNSEGTATLALGQMQ